MITTLQDQEVEVLANRLLESPDFIRRMAMAIEDFQEPKLPPLDVAEVNRIRADIKAGREQTRTWQEFKAEYNAVHS